MNDRTSTELEREAEEIRAGIAQTAEALQDRMSPGKMVDEFMTYMKDSDGSLAVDNLRKQARDNPMALAMIGSGFAWLMFGGGGASSHASSRHGGASGSHDTGHQPSASAFRAQAAYPAGNEPAGKASALRDAAGGVADKANDVGSRVADAAGQMADKAGDVGSRVAGAAGHMADRIRDASDDVSDRARRLRHDAADRGYAAADDMRDMADRGRRTLMDALEREPLVLGAIGVAVGAALGAMLPSTRFENETFGKTRDSLVRDAENVVDRAAETARNVASEAVQAAKTASKDEGLVIDGKAITERVGEVAKAALSAGKEAADRDMKSPDEGEAQRRETSVSGADA